MSVFTRLWADNPVLVKELRVRMRGARAYWILTGYLGFLSLILFFRYMIWSWWSAAQPRGGGLSSGSKIGQDFFSTITMVQAFLVVFITPAVTSGAITIEREQRTMEMLEMTRLPRAHIVAGKLLSAVSFIALLLISSLPLTSICFFLGGVSPERVVHWYLILLAGSFVTGALGLAWSTIARTTSAAVIFTYGSLLIPPLLLVVTGALVSGDIFGGRSNNSLTMVLTWALAASLFGINPSEAFGYTPLGPFFQWWDARHFYGLTLPVWIAPTLSCFLLGLTLAAVATARLETFPERKAPLLRALVAIFFLQQLFFYLGARFSAYSGAAPPGLGAQMSAYPLLSMLGYPVLLMLCCAPIFATGEITAGEARALGSYLASGWTPAGWKQGKLASGLPFLWLLTALMIGMYVLSFAFIGQPGRAATGQVAISGYSALPVPPSGVGGLPQAALMLFVTMLGLSTLGLFFSVIVRNRWAAMALGYVALLAILIVPQIAYTNYINDMNQRPPSLLINLYYLNPMMSIAEMTDTSGAFWHRFPLMFGTTPIWIITTIGYLLLSGLALLFTLPFAAKAAQGAPLSAPETTGRITIVRNRRR